MEQLDPLRGVGAGGVEEEINEGAGVLEEEAEQSMFPFEHIWSVLSKDNIITVALATVVVVVKMPEAFSSNQHQAHQRPEGLIIMERLISPHRCLGTRKRQFASEKKQRICEWVVEICKKFIIYKGPGRIWQNMLRDSELLPSNKSAAQRIICELEKY